MGDTVLSGLGPAVALVGAGGLTALAFAYILSRYTLPRLLEGLAMLLRERADSDHAEPGLVSGAVQGGHDMVLARIRDGWQAERDMLRDTKEAVRRIESMQAKELEHLTLLVTHEERIAATLDRIESRQPPAATRRRS